MTGIIGWLESSKCSCDMPFYETAPIPPLFAAPLFKLPSGDPPSPCLVTPPSATSRRGPRARDTPSHSACFPPPRTKTRCWIEGRSKACCRANRSDFLYCRGGHRVEQAQGCTHTKSCTPTGACALLCGLRRNRRDELGRGPRPAWTETSYCGR